MSEEPSIGGCRDTRGSVPRVSAFFGIVIYMYWEEADHHRPHFHADYVHEIRWTNMPSMADVLPLVHVTGVAVIGDHQLRLLFEDGTVGDVSFADRKWRGVFEPLRDAVRFAKVTVEHGTIVWPDEGLDMAPEPLYQAALAHPVPAASLMP